MPIYNKLVRDGILEIIKENGKEFNSRILLPHEHLIEIKKKLYEEVKEFELAETKEDSIEELADVLELLHSALKSYNIDFEYLDSIRVKKKEKRGGFDKGIYLIDVED